MIPSFYTSKNSGLNRNLEQTIPFKLNDNTRPITQLALHPPIKVR